ncbi:ankyrin repeat domain-containing protein [Legionella erythra]|uniref:Ankyrin repeat-containing protein n=2 Tax=Legionella erythra TaxID=448 RepID=A0A0W0TQN2_LEGER|nr:ankyrin repeat domain-containing protein [Legionella erythra]KTC97833.1 ankyrin repeat-containing protein [Legionella erythra]
MPSTVIDYRDKLIQSGIRRDLIPPALTNEQCQVLFRKLNSFSMSWIRGTWQLLAILGDEEPYRHLDQKDNFNVNMAHYAAFSGDIQRLNQVLAQNPHLFSQFDKGIKGAAHYAALSGNPAALQWIKDNKPDLLNNLDKEDRTIAHRAAQGGNVAALQWIKDNKPDLLNRMDMNGWTIAHYAARFGNPEVLQWIKNNKPDLLNKMDKDGCSIAHHASRSGTLEALNWIKKNHLEGLLMDHNARDTFLMCAALSGNGEQLNLALALCGNPSTVNFKRIPADDSSTVIDALREALQSNYILRSVVYPHLLEPCDEVEMLLDKNGLIAIKLNKLSDDFTVLCQQDTTGARTGPLSKDALLTLFTTAARAISPRIPEKDIKAQFYKIYNNSNALKHDAALAAKGKVLDFKMKSETLTGFRAFFINKKVAHLKRHAMAELNALILNADTFTENDLRQWYLAHNDSINRQTHTLTGLFFKTRETASRALVSKICQEFKFNEQLVTAKPENDHAGKEPIAVFS